MERTEKQYTYNVTLQRVRVTIIAVETQQCILCFFFHISFRARKCIEHKMSVLIVSTVFVWNIPHSKKHSASYCRIVP